MAAIEQLVFGLAPDRDKGRDVLASSPGISRECAQEVVRLCEGWGAVPAEGMRRPALMCFPLNNRLSSLPGELHVVIHVAESLKPIYHALVLNRADFQEFDLNPFALAQENVFLSKWTVGEDLPRRDVRPGSLAPLVSPPPGAGDVGFADEAVRQMLANHRLLLPLERASSDSDRFLALVVAGLPRALRQELRFASWSPSGTNSYTLAATYRENALFTSWQPFLMTSVFGQLNDACEEYLDQLKIHLRSGDLAGLERHSRNARVDLGRIASSLTRKKPMSVTATIDPHAARRTMPAAASASPRRKGLAGAAAGPSRPRPQPKQKMTTRSAPPRPRSRPRPLRRRTAGGLRRRFAAVLSAAILLAGAYYLWTSGQWTRLPGAAGGTVRLQTDTSHGVVDIATIYQGALEGLQKGAAGGSANTDAADRRRGLEILDQAGELLEVQGQGFLDEVDQTLSGDDLHGIAPAPAERLHERGRVLARELRRLALAQVSLRGQVDWRDLADLEERELEARFDSLLARRDGRQSVEPELAQVDHLLRSVDIRSRQVGGLARLQDLLSRDRWDEVWCRQCDAAIDDLGGVQQSRALRLRDDARILVRLKRAEHATDLARRAYRDDYSASSQITPAVADILPQVHRRAGADETTPALLRATSSLYLNLNRAADPGATSAQRAASIRNVAASPALDFDTAVYGEHLGRLRFMLLEEAAGAGAEPDSLPEVCFDGGNRQDHLDFLRARRDGLDADGWRELSTTLREPFLVRWAQHRADQLDAASARRSASFGDDLAALRSRRSALVQLIGAGGDGTELWRDLTAEAKRMRDRYRGSFSDSVAAGAAYERVQDLASALEATPPLVITGVTVRLAQDLTVQPREVIAELEVGADPPLTSGWVRLGPAAPAGTGWVGNGEMQWELGLAPGTELSVRVLDADGGAVIGRVDVGGWLTAAGPQDLGALEIGEGVRVAWRLAGPYWRSFTVPELDGSPSP